LLIDEGADVNQRSAYCNYTPLFLAAKFGKIEIAKLLLAEGAGINDVAGEWDQTPLHIAIEFSNIEMVKYLLENGADLNIGDKSGWTPHETVSYTDKNANKIIELLINTRHQRKTIPQMK
jgi:ankyrin repeat protein